MSVQAISHVIEHSKQKGSSFVVLLMIANHAHSDGRGAFPSFDTIARESRISYRQVTRIVPMLAGTGELIVHKGKGPSGSNLYEIPLDKMSLRKSYTGTFEAKQGQNVYTSGVANVPLTVSNRKSKENRKEPNMLSKEVRQKRKDREDLDHLQRILRENPNLATAEKARIQLIVDDLKRKLAA